MTGSILAYMLIALFVIFIGYVAFMVTSNKKKLREIECADRKAFSDVPSADEPADPNDLKPPINSHVVPGGFL